MHSTCRLCDETRRFISYRVDFSQHIDFAKQKYRANVVCISTKGEPMEKNKNLLREETIDFAIEVSDICDNIAGSRIYVNQLIRSSSSIGANVHEAKYAQSRADFISKLEIALKESSETDYWLELIYRKKLIDEITYKNLKNRCGIIRRKLISSVTTAKSNSN